MRTVFLDYDTRTRNKTLRFCVRCQKDIKLEAKARIVRVTPEAMVIHPEDVQAGIGEDFLIGVDCARKIGMEFSRPELP
ncbi:MAG TPA: hypothetical protein VGP89_18245 [Candidatus Angelobacter sp.]|jgi:hypothetical protein|nr:hypothetical protein [Candidatus Angelobacter sp.]